MELLTAVYGLVDGPVVWRETLRRHLLELGYQESLFDPCLYWLPSVEASAKKRSPGQQLAIDGVVLADVDELLQGGGPRDDAKMSELRLRLTFGKWRSGQGEYLGRTLTQGPGFEIEVSFERYVDERLFPIDLTPKRKKQGSEVVTEGELRQLRAAVGGCLWVAREGRHDVGASSAMITMKHHEDKQYRVSDLIEANKVIQELKGTKGTVIRINPLDLEKIVWVVVSDASSFNHSDGKS